MKQRTKQPVVTRQLILAAAGAEFTEHGYSGAGLNAIVAKAGLTKGALFHHFPDKRSLAAAWAAGDMAEAIRDRWITPLAALDSLDALRAYCRMRCMESHPGDATSALVSIAAETVAADRILGAAFQEIIASWQDAFAVLLERGKSAGWIHHSIQPGVEAAILVSMYSGFTVTMKCNPDESFRRLCATGVEGYLETLRPQ